jgi:arylsulfatase A-like enzyme
MSTRSLPFVLVAALALSGALTPIRVVAAQAAAPNFLIVIADDLGTADVGFNGAKDTRTPHLDRLAASGARLTQFYVQPVCSPTRAALLTGRYPIRYGLQVGVVRPWAQYGLPLEERTLPQALKEHGYKTFLVGKWHLGAYDPAYLPTRRGFDHHYGNYLGAVDYYTHERDGGFDWHRDGKISRDAGYSTHLLAREAVRVIEAQPRNQPFYLQVAFTAVHAPHQVPAAYKTPFAHLPEPRRTYAGMLAALDEGIGQILAALDRAGQRTNTLVFFSSDNGGFGPGRVTDNRPLRAGKGTLYEGGVRVAACVAWPGRIPAGTEISAPLHVVDLYPTLLQLAGAPPPSSTRLPLDGRDAWPAWTAGQPSPHDVILINAEPNRGALRQGDWKLVLNGERSFESAEEFVAKPPGPGPNQSNPERVELFNLRLDVSETNNLARLHPERVAELRRHYDQMASQAVPPRNTPRPPGFRAPKIWGDVAGP